MGLTDFYYINFNINMNSNIFKMTTRMDNIMDVVSQYIYAQIGQY